MVRTATHGDNGGWFRNVSEEGNFWYVCYRESLDRVRRGEAEIVPTFMDDYLDQHGARDEVNIRAGAWNTGWNHGADFLQWTGLQTQKDALSRLHEFSCALHGIEEVVRTLKLDTPEIAEQLEQGRWLLMRAETSCNLYWGEV